MENLPLKIRRIIISRNAYRWQFGGAEQFSFNLAHALKDIGIEPIVVSRVPELLRSCRLAKITVFANFWLHNETHRVWMPAYYLLSTFLVAQYLWLILAKGAGLFIASSRDDQIFGTIAAKLCGIPVLWIDHADMKHIVASKFRFLRGLYYYALKKADRVVVVSEAEKAKILKNLNPELHHKFTVIHNGALLKPAKPLPRPADGLIVAYSGRIEADKGMYDLLGAAKLCLNQSPNLHFWLAGKGQAEAELKQLSSPIKNFKLLGHLEHIASLLTVADIFVYPTHHDASPLAPVEAMLAGLPIVATDIGGIPEITTSDCAILVPANDPPALAKAILKLAADPKLRQKMSKASLKNSRELEFNSVVTNKYLPLFKQLTEGGAK